MVSLWDGAPCSTGYLTGRLETDGEGGLVFTTRFGGKLDHGRDFYAPAVRQDDDRALMWGWSWEARQTPQVLAAGWAGTLTAPRVVDVHPDGSLRVAPAPELELLRAPEPFTTVPGRRVPLPCGVRPHGHRTRSYGRHPAAGGGPGADGRAGPGGGHARPGPRRLRPRAGAEGSAPVTVRVPPGPGLTVRVLVDGSLLELFVADRATVTERVYRRPDDVAELEVDGDAEVTGWEQVPPRRG